MKNCLVRKGMGERGVLFTFMVFMIVMIVLGLGTTIKGGRLKFESDVTKTSALEGTSNKFGNIMNDVVNFDKNNLARNIQKRIMPFDYEYDGNAIRVGQELPMKVGMLDLSFDILNAYDIFISDTNSQTTYDLMHVDVNAAKNKYWGGDRNSIQFMIKPQCLKFVVVDENVTGFFGGIADEGCASGFSVQSLRRYDLNILIKQANQAYNNIVCNFAGSPPEECPTEIFSSGDNDPYFEMFVDDSLCTNCQLGGQTKHIYGHYDPASNNTVGVSCAGGPEICGVTINPILVTVNSGMKAENKGGALDVNMRAELGGNIMRFYFMDFNFAVSRPDFNTMMTNVGQ
ncbi:MAG: hypothetical protein V1676_05620 [Candidatus Diapherotrites archaeon]